MILCRKGGNPVRLNCILCKSAGNRILPPVRFPVRQSSNGKTGEEFAHAGPTPACLLEPREIEVRERGNYGKL